MSDPRAEATLDEAVEALQDGRLEDALSGIDAAISLDAGLSRAHHARSLVLERLGRVPAARDAAEAAISLDPGSPAIREQLGDLWLDADPVRAEAAYREAIRLDSWDQRGARRAVALNNLGVALSRQKKRREAALAFKAALLIDPTLTEAKKNARASIMNLARGAALLVAIDVLLRAAKGGRHATKLEALRPYEGAAVAATAALLVAGVAVWAWRRTAGMARLATEEPELHALWRRLEAERKARG